MMACQLEFAEQRAFCEFFARNAPLKHRGASVDLRRAYDALLELAAAGSAATAQALAEYRGLYLQAFQAYNRGDLQNAELLARSVKHLCRAAWFDAKIKYLESHADDLPHVPGLVSESMKGIAGGIAEVTQRLSRLKLTGLADRFGSRARKHIARIESLPDNNTILADTFMKAAFEYCLATEALQAIELRTAA